jgi:hypothetical protein
MPAVTAEDDLYLIVRPDFPAKRKKGAFPGAALLL